jgi:hypothetical protein
MKRDEGIIKGETRDGLTGSPPPRPRYAFQIDDDTPAPPVPMVPYKDDHSRLEMMNLVALLPALIGVVFVVIFAGILVFS